MSNTNLFSGIGLGQKRTSTHVRGMSDLPPKADIGTQPHNVRFVPKADVKRASAAGGRKTLASKHTARDPGPYSVS